MYTHNLLTSASLKQKHNTPLTARRLDINSSSLHFQQGEGGGQGKKGVHIHRRTEDGGWRGGPRICSPDLATKKHDQTHGQCPPTPRNTVEVLIPTYKPCQKQTTRKPVKLKLH